LGLLARERDGVRDERGEMEEERGRGEPGPVLAPGQFDTPTKKSFPRLWLGSLRPIPPGQSGAFRAAGAPPGDHYYRLELCTRHTANPGSALATMLLDRAFVSSYKLPMQTVTCM